jgi:beta-glucosidase
MLAIPASFPPGFLWGVSTSSHQFEGGNTFNQWYDWERAGNIRTGDSCDLACDWWTNAERDLDLCAALGLNAIRISLEWSRLEPAYAHWSDAAVIRYREIIRAARNRGMRVFVTLHHFTHPRWFEARGGFLNDNAHQLFRHYCKRAVRTLGDLVTDWVTFNEPNVYTAFGYLFGDFPPGRVNELNSALSVLSAIMRAHGEAYDEIHRQQPSANVGIAVHYIAFEPARDHVLDRQLVATYDALFNRSVLLYLQGEPLPLPFAMMASATHHCAGKIDFIGLNVYNRLYVRAPFGEKPVGPGGLYVPRGVPQGDSATNSSYGEACPRVVCPAVEAYSALDRPIYVMENGVPDHADRIRPWLMVNSIKEVRRMWQQGHDIRGYFHWSLVDNFEWSEGWRLRFGLYELDRTTGERIARPSAEIYRSIIADNGIRRETLELWENAPQSPELDEMPGISSTD